MNTLKTLGLIAWVGIRSILITAAILILIGAAFGIIVILPLYLTTFGGWWMVAGIAWIALECIFGFGAAELNDYKESKHVY